MIERYTLPEMGKIWSDRSKYEAWWKVELEVCRVQFEIGVIPAEDFDNIEQKAAFDVKRILEIEEEVKHDVIAFLTNVAENVGESSRYIHKGMTSSDLLDTALALQLAQAGDLLREKIVGLIQVLTDKSLEFKDTLCIGRSHGIHAEPVTFGLKFLIWKKEMERNLRRFDLALEDVKVGQISGAVGTYQHLDPEVEIRTMEKLGLAAAPVSNQVIQRDRHAHFVATLATIGSTLDKIAVEIRHLQRTEVLEAEEYFSKGQKGSSAMPHKRNPILSERISGMARLLRGYTVTAMENVALWHERDISHSSAERVILPDACITLDFILAETTRVLKNLLVYPEKMMENLNLTRGLIFSQEVLLKLVEKGILREKAYRMVQENAMQVWREGRDFKTLLLQDKAIMEHLTREEVEELFGFEKLLARVNQIFNKVK
ncbi:MAG: adenylosuccinate lyase [Candidatus Marinimicrobia bacterium]|nr:adenylosuccinate lyase [Candidatus Neomarinimicrobiota bacterium]